MIAPESLLEEAETSTLYSVCFFERDWIVPEVQFLEAENDSDALAFAKSMRPGMRREIWDRHRLVRVLPPSSSAALERRLPTSTSEPVPTVAPSIRRPLSKVGYSSYEDLQRDILDKDALDRSEWEHTMTVPMRFNRLVLLQPQYWHTAGPGFGDSLENGRLIYLMFFLRGPPQN